MGCLAAIWGGKKGKGREKQRKEEKTEIVEKFNVRFIKFGGVIH